MTKAPATHRPEKVTDLSVYEQGTPTPVLDVHDASILVKIPGAITALGGLLDVINAHNERGFGDTALTIAANRGEIEITMPSNPDEGRATLARRQADYDAGRAQWQQYLDDPDSVDTSKPNYAWAYYLRREQLTDPTKQDVTK